MPSLAPNFLETGEKWAHYVILEKTDQSDIHIAYSAVDSALDRHVLIKIFLPPYSSSNKDILRFKEQARKLAILQSKHIVPFYGIGVERGMYYTVTPYIQGYTLKDWIDSGRVFEEEKALQFMTQAVAALDYARQHEVLHLSIKPIRFVVDWDDIFQMTNFGFVQCRNHLTGKLKYDSLANPYYAAPEQISGKEIGFHTDIYCLGATLFHLMTGVTPFDQGTPDAVCLAHLQSPFPEQKAQTADVPEGWIDLMSRMMEKEPSKRFQSYQEISNALVMLS